MIAEINGALRPLSLAVVGGPYPNPDGSNRMFEILLCAPGEPVELRLEPKNKYDENAIAVLSARGVQIGYLSAERAPRIGQLVRQGREVLAIFQNATETGAWIRAAFDGEVPELPPQRPPIAVGADCEPDWQPDEEWPDD